MILLLLSSQAYGRNHVTIVTKVSTVNASTMVDIKFLTNHPITTLVCVLLAECTGEWMQHNGNEYRFASSSLSVDFNECNRQYSIYTLDLSQTINDSANYFKNSSVDLVGKSVCARKCNSFDYINLFSLIILAFNTPWFFGNTESFNENSATDFSFYVTTIVCFVYIYNVCLRLEIKRIHYSRNHIRSSTLQSTQFK